MTINLAGALIVLLFLIELVYFKIAVRYSIIDRPNERSSHTKVTIRGGGIIFVLSVLLFFCSNSYQYPFFVTGLFLVSLVSFLDDLLTLNNKVRLIVQLVSVALIICEWGAFSLPWYWLVLAIPMVIGSINAYNFMDGINGITGFYSIVTVITLYYINVYIINFTSTDLLIYLGFSLMVFNYFNFRKQAKCFAGDVGSISIAFCLMFLIGKLILKTGNYAYILLLLIYGLDTVTTIIFRIFRKENIFEAHRSHFFQYLANEYQMPHVYVAAGYGLTQLVINILLIKYSFIPLFLVSLISFSLTFTFICIRFLLEGSTRLLKK